ncbi:hypothetical protein V5O48_001806 [Marasmius crinis-equi]|uniref:Tyrosinase copper-binding domain-containing protein n=1 Tax=Marasmius crinis-equi TaxID=585013 RepID=A0ABR3FXT6_9AGAR
MRLGAVILRAFIVLATISVTIRAQSCTNPSVRREWRKLSDGDKQAYHAANLCLRSRPKQRYNENFVVTRLDDLTWTHVSLADQQVIHYVADFLPWHRMFVNEHEKMLREECGYTGPYAYWDWTIDADANAVPNSPIWDSVNGFGGNGVETGRSDPGFEKCVDGPYSNATLSVGAPPFSRDGTNMPHCLLREWNNGHRDSNGEWNVGSMSPSSYNSQAVARASSQTNYAAFLDELERRPHDAVIGGDMREFFAVNDPIFLLHHANVDRIWARWQGSDPARLNEYSGFNDIRSTQRASIDDLMPMLNLLDQRPRVRDYMNTRAGSLCYVYE